MNSTMRVVARHRRRGRRRRPARRPQGQRRRGLDEKPTSGAASGGQGPAQAATPTIVDRQERQAGRRDRRDLGRTRANRSASRCGPTSADEVHIHGYDIMKDVKAGGSVTFDFPATIEGDLRGRARGPQGTDPRAAGQPVGAPDEPAPGPAARPRAGRAAGPADPGLAVRLGGVDRPDRLLLRALGRLARAALRERTLAPARGGRSRGPCSACPRRSSAARSASSCSASPSTPGCRAPKRRIATSRSPSSSSPAGSASRSSASSSATSSSRSTRGGRSAAPSAAPSRRSPASASPTCAYPERLGRWPAAIGPGRLRLAGDRLRRQRRRRGRRLARTRSASPSSSTAPTRWR